MRALSNRELDSVSGGFGLGNLIGGLVGGLGGLGGGAQNPLAALAPAANTNTIPAVSYPQGAAAPAAGFNLGGLGGLGQLLSPIQSFTSAFSNFLQHPLRTILSLVGTGIQQAVNFVTRLI
ncbi:MULTISPECIES: hypothetical protein [Acetobacteraceae]|uniref:Uncharacterized protein n=2 Tax=Acetobacteraceae TaxID=433 RepID=A0A7U7J043_9PROT|nr:MULTISPECIES: hypothetical protein [Acetobacteraceae]MCQ0041472.1 hypothetical protein [Bombella sp.]MUG78831.1 hypothetical protein [Bombella sp. ESL0380]MUH02104.1 hypothetical protein [Bombella sp. ESL0387]QGT74579.1 hypothetical protein GN304_01535 [Bombella sp. ESL0368]MCL1512007.1 hypothetical protein [Parasaccharibacter sp. TMW 2.1884]